MFSNSAEKKQAILHEIRFLKHLSGHTNIIRFITAASLSPDKAISGKTEFLVCVELCPGQ